MVLKSAAVLSCLLPARRGHRQRHPEGDTPGDPALDPFRGPDTDPLRPRANTAPSEPPPPPPVPPARPKRSSFTTFFAFSSKRRSSHGLPIIHLQQDTLTVPGKWTSGSSQVHLANATSIPSPLKTDEEEYYYSYYTSLTPSPRPHPSSRQQDHAGNPDLDSQPSSPVDSHPSHTQMRHPYAYSTPLYSKPYPRPIDAVPHLRHATSQPLQHAPIETRHPSSHLGHEPEPHLKTSLSTPNLVSGATPLRSRSVLRKKHPTRSKGQDRWLSAESWWDALFSPSPRFRLQRAPRPNPPAETIVNHPVRAARAESSRNLAVTFPSMPATRARAVSVTSTIPNNKPAHPVLSRSRSAVDLSGKPTSPTPHPAFEPALETLADEPTPPPDRASSRGSELPPPDPPLSLEQVLDEGEAFDHQRAQWKEQAYKSLGNKHTRSFSRARSKSLGERHAHFSHHPAESSKAQFNLEFLAARTLLGSQSIKPVVHVTKPTSSSSHSKAYSHSHSQSAHSYAHSSHSRAYSHSHSHSLTTSNSSKSSRHLPSRSHFRNGSWGKTALLKAGSLCGFSQDESYVTDEKVPSSSRVDTQDVGDPAHADVVMDVSKAPSPPGEVGIAVSSSPRPDGSFDLDASGPPHSEGDRDSRWSSRHTHKSSEYAGPHPSAIDSNLPPFSATSDISLRHRLPPRATPHPPVTPIPHPYRSATVQSEQAGDKGSKGASSREKVTEKEVSTRRTPYPHISLSHADFSRYGVGEALVYASLPRPEPALDTKQADVPSESSPVVELPSPQEQSPSCETAGMHSEERDSSSLAMHSVPSLTNSTIQMVMSAFDNPDDLDEFQDLFYKPLPTPGSQSQEPSVAIRPVPTDVRSSKSSSPLTHLVRKLSEGVSSLRDPARTPSDPPVLQDQHVNESGSKFVFMDLARSSSSPAPMASTSQVHVPIQEGGESIPQPVLVVPEDVNSFYTSSVLESPLEDHENDTFGHPIKHGHLEAASPPEPIQSPVRVSTHFSIQEDEADDDDDGPYLSTTGPVRKRFGVVSVDAVRASYVTTSDMSQMSGLSDFPLPPSARPVSILQAYFETTSPSPSPSPSPKGHAHHPSDDDETEMGHVGGEGDADGDGDVEATLRALRTTPRVSSFESRRSTFGGSDDMEFITQLHRVGP